MKILLLLSTLLPLTASQSTPGFVAPNITDAAFKAWALYTHNVDRAQHGSPALVWDDTLANFALQWANRCLWAHSDGPYGENLHGVWVNFALDFINQTRYGIHEGWYNEIRLYDYNNPGFSTATGHFTQVVWKNTTSVGCAWNATPCRSGMWYWWELVCEYRPRGNILNDAIFRANVLPPSSRMVGSLREGVNVNILKSG